MAKKKEPVAKPVSKWDGGLLNLIGKSLLQFLVFAIFFVVGAYVATMKIRGNGTPWTEDLANGGVTVWALLAVGIILIGIGYCWAVIIGIKYEIKHCVINGQRLKFKANTFNLILNIIKWTILTVITLGIYSLWMPVKVRKWVVKHIESDVEEDEDEDEETEEEEIQYPITYYTVDDDGNYEEMTFEDEDED